jgi:hypothetical protein
MQAGLQASESSLSSENRTGPRTITELGHYCHFPEPYFIEQNRSQNITELGHETDQRMGH